MSLAKGIGLRAALDNDIPIMAYGWSPGQIPLASAILRPNPRMLRAMLDTARAPLQKMAGRQFDVYFPQEQQLESARDLPTNVSPLAFLDYDEDTARRQIEALGWIRPQDTDPNSTNCLLNSFANVAHLEQLGYHPYAMELAGLVREGFLSREEALNRLDLVAVPEVLSAVETRLGVRASQK